MSERKPLPRHAGLWRGASAQPKSAAAQRPQPAPKILQANAAPGVLGAQPRPPATPRSPAPPPPAPTAQVRNSPEATGRVVAPRTPQPHERLAGVRPEGSAVQPKILAAHRPPPRAGLAPRQQMGGTNARRAGASPPKPAPPARVAQPLIREQRASEPKGSSPAGGATPPAPVRHVATVQRTPQRPGAARTQTPQALPPRVAGAQVLQRTRAPGTPASPKPPPVAPSRPPTTVVQRATAQRGAASNVIQCAFANVSYQRIDNNGAYANEVRQALESVKEAVENAYQYVISNPTLGVLASIDGHTQHWVQKWNAFLLTGNSQLMGADFGYAIESVATHPKSPYCPKAPPNMHFELQGARGPTRPDVILWRVGLGVSQEVAWFDITASDSDYHIFTAKIGWDNQTNVAEITYPSTDMEKLKGMAHLGKGLVIDPGELYRQMRFQEMFLEQLRQIFQEQGKEVFGGLKPPLGDKSIRDQRRRQWVMDKLRTVGPLRGANLTESDAANILYAMGLSPKTYGFSNSLSKSTGTHLLKMIQNVPTMTAPPQMVPRLMPTQQPPPFFFGQNFNGVGSTSGPLVPVNTQSQTRSVGIASRLKHLKATNNPKRLTGVDRVSTRLHNVLGRMMSPRGFTANSLAHALSGSGIALDDIKSARFVVYSRQKNEYFRFDFARGGGFKLRRTSAVMSRRALELSKGQSPTPLALPSTSSPTSLTTLNDAGGQIVNFSPTETFQLVAYQVQTEDEEMHGANANVDIN